MIIKEEVLINGEEFIKTYSDKNKYIESEGIMYSEAFDLAELNKEYTETNILFELETPTGIEVTETD